MSRQTDYDKLSLLGIEIDAISNLEAIGYICAHAAPGQPACYVIKPYVEFLDRAYNNDQLQDLLNHAEISLADGVALTWASAYLYAGPRTTKRFFITLSQIILAPKRLAWPLVDRTAGINFTWPLLKSARDNNLRVCIIGKEKEADIAQVGKIIGEQVPGITLAGVFSGRDLSSSYGEVSETWLQQTAQSIASHKPDIILVGMGFPLQEKVCAYLAAHTQHGVYIGEGGTFDYESFGGTQRKAPAWMQRSGLEWLWRLVLQPRRIVRQLAIPRFIFRIWKNK